MQRNSTIFLPLVIMLLISPASHAAQTPWLHYYLKTANMGDPFTQAVLAGMYVDGRRVARDYQQATHWYALAANQGHHGAQHNLATLYRKGQGVERDYEKALQLYQKAASQNYSPSQNSLGNMYLKGEGVAVDLVSAHQWFYRAEQAGNTIAQRNRLKIERLMTAEQIQLARRLPR